MIRNFIFHKIVPQYNGGMLEMSIEHFEKCVQYISSKYTVVLLENIGTQKATAGKKPFATLTFDDGYRNNLKYAIPILDKYDCKGSFYVVTDCIERNVPIWIHQVEHYFLETDNVSLSLKQAFLPKHLHINSTPAKGVERNAYFAQLRHWLKHAPVDQKDEVVNYLFSVIKDVDIEEQMMTWEDLAALKKDGHYIGAHSHTHDALTFITDDDRLRSEFELPRFLIQKYLGYMCDSFSYPFGYCNDRIRNMAKATGYRLGIAAERHELYIENKHDIFEIPRIALCNEPWWKTKLRITNRIEDIKRLLPPYKYKYRKF